MLAGARRGEAMGEFIAHSFIKHHKSSVVNTLGFS